MGSLLTGEDNSPELSNALTSNIKRIKILSLGGEAAGKSCLIEVFINKNFR
jgi:GTPase SAR1 family protein